MDVTLDDATTSPPPQQNIAGTPTGPTDTHGNGSLRRGRKRKKNNNASDTLSEGAVSPEGDATTGAVETSAAESTNAAEVDKASTNTSSATANPRTAKVDA